MSGPCGAGLNLRSSGRTPLRRADGPPDGFSLRADNVNECTLHLSMAEQSGRVNHWYTGVSTSKGPPVLTWTQMGGQGRAKQASDGGEIAGAF
eukprot:scaffold79328_cov22-Tisochrysis_lutea.AAC.1